MDRKPEPRQDPRIQTLETRLGHRFADARLLRRALTHRSCGADHNERLEFLGDAVLNLAVSTLLYERFSGSDEGDLTRVRAHLVREDSLHRAALGLGLPEVLRLIRDYQRLRNFLSFGNSGLKSRIRTRTL